VSSRVTLAPEITAPDASVTCPLISPEFEFWAQAPAAPVRIRVTVSAVNRLIEFVFKFT
jgi:hypothetical protein